MLPFPIVDKSTLLASAAFSTSGSGAFADLGGAGMRILVACYDAVELDSYLYPS